ncbi:hypothetical protein ACRTAL_002351 [Clostridium perfringens]|jgi:hypothetical protein|uniref:hypothetical protein n=1 Tax=Clostridium perfringens TaxID=1502 RepID=UPI001F052187|nr:hypothetical protein [Clostridium perfringens]MCH1964333.1 hypothetical protein [Clostridium perfringens]
MSRGNKLQSLSEFQRYNDDLSDYELKQILDIYKKVIYRIKNRSNKYKCPYCGEYLIKDYEYIYDNGTKIEEYKCFQHYYTYQTTIKQ